MLKRGNCEFVDEHLKIVKYINTFSDFYYKQLMIRSIAYMTKCKERTAASFAKSESAEQTIFYYYSDFIIKKVYTLILSKMLSENPNCYPEDYICKYYDFDGHYLIGPNSCFNSAGFGGYKPEQIAALRPLLANYYD